MATNKTETETNTQELKHLGFVRIAAIQALVCVSNLYDYAKQNLGPLRSTVGTVERAVTTVVAPVFEKFKGVPDDLLSFLDHKLDVATEKFDKHAPSLAKQIASRTHSFVKKGAEKAQKFANEFQTAGPRAAVHYAASEYKNFVVDQSVNLWATLNRYPPVHTVADKAAPTAVNLSEKYNHVVKDLTQKGYGVVGYLPLVPVDEIAKKLKQGEISHKPDSSSLKQDEKAHKSDSSSGSDSD
ncbi:hypothetical protein UlMin_040004 [Ulmus minor]